MKKRILQVLFIFSVLLSLSAFMASRVFAASGAIWTTNDSCGAQNINKYYTGDTVWIKGHQFGINQTINWTVTNNDGVIVASGSTTANVIPGEENKGGQFCVSAYTITANDSGVFRVDVSNKKDNCQANPGVVNPTPTPVTPTVETSPVPTTETPEPQPTIPPTETQEQPTETPPTERQEQPTETPPTERQEQPTETPPTETQEQPTETPPTETQEQPTETPPTETQEQPSETPVTETPQPQVTALPADNPSQTATVVPDVTQTTEPVLTETSSPTQASTNAATQSPQEAPVTGSLADPALLQGATALFGLVSLGSYALLKRKSD